MDLNMLTALAWAGSVSVPRSLPRSLQSVCRRTEMIHAINESIGKINARLYDVNPQEMMFWPFEAQEEFRSKVLKISREFVTEAMDDSQMTALGLRLWAGCLSTAKMIARRTNDGQNTFEVRKTAFEEVIDKTSQVDKVYEAGVEAAPIWKKKVGQGDDVSFDGVPENSAVRRYWKE